MSLLTRVRLPDLHPGQVRALDAYWPSAYQVQHDPGFLAVHGRKRKAVRCGRRWGKTDLIKSWIGDGALKGYPCGIFAPDYKRLSEIFVELDAMLDPAIPSQGGTNKSDGVIRLKTGGRVDFWTLEDEKAGRSRYYKRVAIDEAGYTKSNMMGIWDKAIEPTLTDLRGDCLVASNTNGIDPENFLWAICHQPKHRFIEVHEPSWNNPWVPRPILGMSPEEVQADRDAYYAEKRANTHPLVFAQEYESAFVDWSGVAFFGLDKWLDADGRAAPWPPHCDRVFAVVDSATKTGSGNDGTAVIYFARNQWAGTPLVILDWEIVQVEGDVLHTWLEGVHRRLHELAEMVKAREGARGIWIEDKNSGMVLIMQGRKRWGHAFVNAIGGTWMQLGKDERAMSVSDYHYQGKCRVSEYAHNKVTVYKGTSRNHLEGQVSGFRIGDKDAAKRADDLLDAYVHGLALTFGDNKQF